MVDDIVEGMLEELYDEYFEIQIPNSFGQDELLAAESNLAADFTPCTLKLKRVGTCSSLGVFEELVSATNHIEPAIQSVKIIKEDETVQDANKAESPEVAGMVASDILEQCVDSLSPTKLDYPYSPTINWSSCSDLSSVHSLRRDSKQASPQLPQSTVLPAGTFEHFQEEDVLYCSEHQCYVTVKEILYNNSDKCNFGCEIEEILLAKTRMAE